MPRHIHVHIYTRDAFVASQHPRGQPKNKGQFAKKGSTSAPTKTQSKPSLKHPSPPTKSKAYSSTSGHLPGIRSALEKTIPSSRTQSTRTGLSSGHLPGNSTASLPKPAPRIKGQTSKPKVPSGTSANVAAVQASNAAIAQAVEAYNHSKKTAVDQKNALGAIAKSVFDYMGIDKSVGFKVEQPYSFSVGNKQFKTGGWFKPEDNSVTLCTNVDPTNPQVAGLVSHEAMHAKFDAVKKAYDDEDERLFNDMIEGRGGAKGVRKPDDTIRPEYQAEYPIHTLLPHFAGNTDVLRKEDGITDYSRAYWQGVEQGDGDMERAVDETLAEMARLDREGSLPNLLWYKRSKSYRPLYEAIHKLYPAAAAKRQ